jgi:hypothetical protein
MVVRVNAAPQFTKESPSIPAASLPTDTLANFLRLKISTNTGSTEPAMLISL